MERYLLIRRALRLSSRIPYSTALDGTAELLVNVVLHPPETALKRWPIIWSITPRHWIIIIILCFSILAKSKVFASSRTSVCHPSMAVKLYSFFFGSSVCRNRAMQSSSDTYWMKNGSFIGCQVSTTTHCHHNSVQRTSLNWRILHEYNRICLPTTHSQNNTQHTTTTMPTFHTR